MTTDDKRARFTLRIPHNLLEMLGKSANEKGISINALILQILWELVNKKDR